MNPHPTSHAPPPLIDPGTEEGLHHFHSEIQLNEALPNLSLHEPTALLLDINNLFKRAQNNNLRIDYLRLKQIFEARCDLRYCAAFSAVDRDQDKALDWAEWMQRIGYTFVGKDLVKYTSQGSGHKVSKGNMDVEITIAAMDLSHAFTHVIIGTCDADFTPLVKRLQADKFRKVSVLGISGTNFAGMSRQLARQADNFYDLSQIQEHIHFNG